MLYERFNCKVLNGKCCSFGLVVAYGRWPSAQGGSRVMLPNVFKFFFYLLIYFMFLVPTVYTPDFKKRCKLKTILNHERIKTSTGLWVEVYLHCKFKVSTERLVLSDAFQQGSANGFQGFLGDKQKNVFGHICLPRSL